MKLTFPIILFIVSVNLSFSKNDNYTYDEQIKTIEQESLQINNLVCNDLFTVKDDDETESQEEMA